MSDKKWSDIPCRNWEWDHDVSGHEGVSTQKDGTLLWYSHRHHSQGGGAREQSFEHFLENGPWVHGVPQKVINDLCQLLGVTEEQWERYYDCLGVQQYKSREKGQ